MLAIGLQIVGHSSLNWALRYMLPTFVTAAVLGEPVGSAILAYLVLRERPSTTEILGSAVVLGGIPICTRAEALRGSA
jgi:drug/metabolite transporter (DMT)-like permease